MKIYCDTNALFSNIVKSYTESGALQRLLMNHDAGKIVMYRSRVGLREVTATKNVVQQQKLIADYKRLQAIPDDEKIIGFNAQTDQLGGFIGHLLVSDVQDEAICRELERCGLERRDAQHVTQAICNQCDVFLTRDCKTIIKPHRTWLEARFPNLRIRLPSEIILELNI